MRRERTLPGDAAGFGHELSCSQGQPVGICGGSEGMASQWSGEFRRGPMVQTRGAEEWFLLLYAEISLSGRSGEQSVNSTQYLHIPKMVECRVCKM